MLRQWLWWLFGGSQLHVTRVVSNCQKMSLVYFLSLMKPKQVNENHRGLMCDQQLAARPEFSRCSCNCKSEAHTYMPLHSSMMKKNASPKDSKANAVWWSKMFANQYWKITCVSNATGLNLKIFWYCWWVWVNNIFRNSISALPISCIWPRMEDTAQWISDNVKTDGEKIG